MQRDNIFAGTIGICRADSDIVFVLPKELAKSVSGIRGTADFKRILILCHEYRWNDNNKNKLILMWMDNNFDMLTYKRY
jgi:hypothetical protein